MISIVVLTYNRLGLLRKCVENVLLRTSERTTEIIIWNNGSADGTTEYLATLQAPKIRVVNHPRNIGQNAYADAFALTSAPYMIEIDDDVTDAPENWDAILLDAFQRLPKVGFLAANLVDDPNDEASHLMHHGRAHLYSRHMENGVNLLKGPTGGGCTITSRALYDRVGGFRRSKGHTFWLEDQAYVSDIAKLGFEACYMEDLRVHHTGGRFYAPWSPEKRAYWDAQARIQARKRVVKRVLLLVPGFASLNERLRFFQSAE